MRNRCYLYYMLATCMFLNHTQKLNGWGCWQNEYRVTFKDGRVLQPIMTCSLTYNWLEKDGLTTFYWQHDVYDGMSPDDPCVHGSTRDVFATNMRAIRKAGVEDMIVDKYEWEKGNGVHFKDEYITFKEVTKVEHI